MKSIKTLAAVGLLALSIPAFAELHWDHAYIGGEVGIADLGTGDDYLIPESALSRNPLAAPTAQSADATDFAWGLRGGVRPLQKGAFDFGLELAYQNFGTAEYTVTNNEKLQANLGLAEHGFRDVEIDAVSALLTGQYNYDRIFAFLKMGAAYARTDINQSDVPDTRNPAQSKVNDINKSYYNLAPAVNFGAGVLLGEYVELFIAYQQLFGINETQGYIVAEEGSSILAMPSELNNVKMASIGINVGNFAYRMNK